MNTLTSFIKNKLSWFKNKNNEEQLQGSSSGKKKVFSLIAILLILGGLIAAVYLSQNPQIFKSKASISATDLQGLTRELKSANQSYKNQSFTASSNTNKNQQINSMVNIAKRRQELLIKQLDDPENFLKNATLYTERNNYPQDIQPFIEQQKQVSGKLEVIIKDDLNKKTSSMSYSLQPQTGPKINVLFAKNLPTVISGAVVSAKGIAITDNLVVENNQNSSNLNFSVQSIDILTTKGEQKTAMLLINFADSSDLISPEDENQLLFGSSNSLASYYQEVSENQTQFTGRVLGWYRINANEHDPCDLEGWENQANEQAALAGVDLSQYRRLIYGFNGGYNCGGGAWSTLGGNPSKVWIFQQNIASLATLTHEMGHSLGADHAASLNCGAKSIDILANCQTDEYGDYYDIMGNYYYVDQNLFHFNGPHKENMGWLPTSHIQYVTGNGTYSIAPLEDKNKGPRVIKIKRKLDNSYYYLSYRQGIGLDTNLPSNITRGASIHLWSGIPNKPTNFIDTTPSSPVQEENDIKDATLSDGSTFTDPLNGIAIKQLSHSSSSAEITVSFTPISQSPTYCAQVISYAINIVTEECRTFSTPCDVPNGWIKVESCSGIGASQVTPTPTNTPGCKNECIYYETRNEAIEKSCKSSGLTCNTYPAFLSCHTGAAPGDSSPGKCSSWQSFGLSCKAPYCDPCQCGRAECIYLETNPKAIENSCNAERRKAGMPNCQTYPKSIKCHTGAKAGDTPGSCTAWQSFGPNNTAPYCEPCSCY